MPAKKKEEQQLLLADGAMPMTSPDKAVVNELGQLLNKALENGSNIETLERVMTLYEKGQALQARQQFNHAFAAFQKELPPVKKTKSASFPTRNGGTMSYTYASLDDVVKAAQPVLHKFGLSYWFEQSEREIQREVEVSPGQTETRTATLVKITCHLCHVSGHSISNSIASPIDTSGNKNVIQQIASTSTYLKRYSLSGVLGLACTDEDMDGYAPDIPVQTPSHYPEDDFQRNLPDWTTRIESGRNTVVEILTSMNSKAAPTPAQVKTLNAIQPKGK